MSEADWTSISAGQTREQLIQPDLALSLPQALSEQHTLAEQLRSDSISENKHNNTNRSLLSFRSESFQRRHTLIFGDKIADKQLEQPQLTASESTAFEGRGPRGQQLTGLPYTSRRHIISNQRMTPKLASEKAVSSILWVLTLPINPDYTISHTARWKELWDWGIIVLVFYNSIYIPLDISFKFSTSVSQGFQWLDLAVDICFAIDIVFSFRTQLPNPSLGSPIKDFNGIAKQYMALWFWIDLLATVPFDAIGALVTGQSTQVHVIGLLKTMRLFRLGRLLKKMDQLSAANFLRIIKLMVSYVMCVHWFACLWWWIAADYAENEEVTWIKEFSLQHNLEDGTLAWRYGICFHFALSAVLPGSSTILPVTNNERSFHSVVMICGALMNAFVFGNVAALIREFDQSKSAYNHHLETFKSFAEHFDVPVKLRQRLIQYLEHFLALQGCFDIQEVTKPLMRPMRYDIFGHIYQDLLKTSKFFEGCDEGFCRVLLSRLTSVICMSGEILVSVEDPVEEVFFLHKGIAAVLSTKGKVMSVIQTGAPIGHLALLRGTRKRRVSVRAVETSIFARLDKSDFFHVLKMFPDHVQRLKEFAQKDSEQLSTTVDVGIGTSTARITIHTKNFQGVMDELKKAKSKEERRVSEKNLIQRVQYNVQLNAEKLVKSISTASFFITKMSKAMHPSTRVKEIKGPSNQSTQEDGIGDQPLASSPEMPEASNRATPETDSSAEYEEESFNLPQMVQSDEQSTAIMHHLGVGSIPEVETSEAMAEIIGMERQSQVILSDMVRPPITAEEDASGTAAGTSADWMYEMGSLLEQIESRITLLETNHESLIRESQNQTEKIMEDLVIVSERIMESQILHGESTRADRIIYGEPANSAEDQIMHETPDDSGELQNSE